jgi:hypothetical protein
MEGFLILVAVLVLGAGGWVLFQTLEMGRDAALERLAARLKLDFRFGLPRELKDALPQFRPIRDAMERGGEFQSGLNSITGRRRGRLVAFFDYQYVTVTYSRSRRRSWFESEPYEHRWTHRASVVAAELGFSSAPLLVRPERWTDKVAAVMGYEDVDFASFREFSSRFYVNGPDRLFARRLITPLLARFFVDRVRCAADFCGPWLLLYAGGRLTAWRAEGLIELASQLADLASHAFLGDGASGEGEDGSRGASR